LAWILASPQVYKDVYGLDPARSIIPFSQPALVTIPLGFLVLAIVSLITYRPQLPAFEVITPDQQTNS
jgi:cation/acetate symporter